jgi:N-hydroxyarylamine O-acetyltransferase
VPLSSAPPLSSELRDRVLDRFGLSSAPPTNLTGLQLLYGRWCEKVPFDNIRKMIALRTGDTSPLPGIRADDFFETWLADGAGGTCWPGANALWALLVSAGFDARRVAGSMRDTGIVTHGTVKVAIDGMDWLVDSSLLTLVPIEIGPRVTGHADPIVSVEVEPTNDGHLVWFEVAPGTQAFPCRLLVDPASVEFFEQRYEASRTVSPFNQRITARRHEPGRATLLVGPSRIVKTTTGQDSCDLTRIQVCECLRDEFGLSGRLIDRWVESGGLEASFEPYTGPTPPPQTVVAPSKRALDS